jgi:preprotein translocase subunit SecG
MLTRFLVILLIIDSIVLVAAILLQSGKGGGLAASFGGASSSADALLGTRQAGNLLTKTSWWAGGIFIFLAFVLQVASARGRTPTSVLDKAVAVPPPAAPTAPATQGGAGPSVVPLQTAPATPAPATPAPAKQP